MLEVSMSNVALVNLNANSSDFVNENEENLDEKQASNQIDKYSESNFLFFNVKNPTEKQKRIYRWIVRLSIKRDTQQLKNIISLCINMEEADGDDLVLSARLEALRIKLGESSFSDYMSDF